MPRHERCGLQKLRPRTSRSRQEAVDLGAPFPTDQLRPISLSIILGLEFLIAGDIIRTVTMSHTLETVSVLAVIGLMCTLLMIMLELGILGRWLSHKAADQ